MLKDAKTDLGSEYFEHESAVLPCQVHPAVSPSHARSGERLLMLALLADAINIFLKGSTERRLLAETRHWIRGVDQACQGVSFEDACDALGIDPAALRERLFALKYGDHPCQTAQRRSSLMLKPPGVSRGPVKVGAKPARRSTSRRRASS
ncbi:MAG TPA: hypothetical protein VGY99_06845 [Candidatus Binataceae bacterium]|jgi:hypothetical protein|nr:hypothetical protein [Candidatus Binataceae bacterium]